MLTAENEMIRDAVREFAVGELGPIAVAVDLEARFPAENWPKLAALDLMGLAVPAALGGAGAGSVAFAVVVEELARICGSTAAAYVTQSALAVGPIASSADDAQRRRWLAPLLRGDAFATLVASDSAVDGVAIVALRRGDGWLLNGTCNAVPGGQHAGSFVVPAHIDEGQEFALFVLDRATPGITVTAAAPGLGLRGLGQAAVAFHDVMLEASARLGDSDSARSVVDQAREDAWIGMAAVSVGIAQGAFERGLRYVRERPQFDRLIIEHESVQWHIADAAIDTEAARQLVCGAARARDGQAPVRRQAAIAKIAATEAAVRVCDRAVQVHGGYGYITEFHVERSYRDAQACAFVAGTIDDLRRLVVHELRREADAGWTLL